MYQKLDAVIGRLMEMAESQNAHILLASDHGFCRMVGTVRPNVMLHEWGYLRLQSPLQRFVRRLRRNLDSVFHKRLDNAHIEFKTPVNWRSSRAMMVYPAMYGIVYLNVKGRNPGGCVDAGADYENILDDLKTRFQSITDPDSGLKIFEAVAAPGEFFGKKTLDPEIVGDLWLIPRDGYNLHQTTSVKKRTVEPTGTDGMAGCHSPDGVYIVNGAGIKKNYSAHTSIVNIAPTVYALMEVPMPGFLDGQCIEEVFVEKPKAISAHHEDISERNRQKADMTQSEEEEVLRRLADLGYLE